MYNADPPGQAALHTMHPYMLYDNLTAILSTTRPLSTLIRSYRAFLSLIPPLRQPETPIQLTGLFILSV